MIVGEPDQVVANAVVVGIYRLGLHVVQVMDALAANTRAEAELVAGS